MLIDIEIKLLLNPLLLDDDRLHLPVLVKAEGEPPALYLPIQGSHAHGCRARPGVQETPLGYDWHYLFLANHMVWRLLLGRLQHYDAWPGLGFLQPRSHTIVPPIGNSCRCA